MSRDIFRAMPRLPPTSAWKFLPGQYLEVIGNEGLRRSYSIANAPRADKQIERHIREVPDGCFKDARLPDHQCYSEAFVCSVSK